MIRYTNSFEGARYNTLLKYCLANDIPNIKTILPPEYMLGRDIGTACILWLNFELRNIIKKYQTDILKYCLEKYFGSIEANHGRFFNSFEIIEYLATNENVTDVLINYIILDKDGYIYIKEDAEEYELENKILHYWYIHKEKILMEKIEEQERNKPIIVIKPKNINHISYDGLPCNDTCTKNYFGYCTCTTDYGSKSCDCNQQI